MKFRPRMGEETYTKVLPQTRCTAEMHRQIKEAASRNHLTQAQFIRQCVDFALTHMEDGKGPILTSGR